MTYQIGDPNHLGVHNDLVTAIGVQAARFGVTVTLPDTAHLGDTGHVDDHNLIVAALAAIEAAPDPGTPPARATGGTETTITDGGKSYRVHTFLGNGTLNVTQEGVADYLIVGAGGSSSAGNYRGGGGGGGLIYRTGIILPVGSYPVVVGAVVAGGSGGSSSVFGETAVGGGAAGGQGYAAAGGGSQGGGGDGQVTGLKSVPGQGSDQVAGGYGGGASQTGTRWHGRQINIDGTLRWYSGGGVGGGNGDYGAGAANYGGGCLPPPSGVGQAAANGGPGIVIVRYPI